MPDRGKLPAYTLPMLLFVALLGLNSLLKKIDNRFWLSSAEYWIYPAQTIFAVSIAVTVFLLWISPQAFFGFAARTAGFNPDILSANPTLYWMTVVLRFVRLVAVVPFVEEIFWRGFLLRYLVDEEFEHVPFGFFSWFSFFAVTVAFAFSHSKADWTAALLTGALYNGVAYR